MVLFKNNFVVLCFFLHFSTTCCITPHSHLQGNVESLLKLTRWNWKHLNTSVKVDTPVSVDISLLSHYRLTGKHFNKYQKVQKQRDCASILKFIPNTKGKDGVYAIYPDMRTKILVYCDMTTEGGGWTVINKRIDGSVDFYRSWDSYKEGFGNVEGEYYLGNEAIHLLTKKRQYELRVDLQKFSGKKAFAKYSKFSVGSESQKFKLTVTGYSGTAGDSLAYHNGRLFSTKDADNDSWKNSCAADRKSGWWYGACDECDLNGQYHKSAVNTNGSVNWEHFGKRKAPISLKSAKMMIRPKN